MEKISVNGLDYSVIKLLGKGKGGYSYLTEREGRQHVVKQIHHEPCDYYRFGNKIQAETEDYQKLSRAGIRMPVMLAVDTENERIVKEYIEGDTIYEIILKDEMKEEYFQQLEQMCAELYPLGLNIDYFPTNFVVRNGLMYYIDYECNDYMEEWNFENWGIKYWSKTPEFLSYAKEHK